MSHGGLPPRRPDQHYQAPPRAAVPGSRLQQIANNKGKTITVQIVNSPTQPVTVQDGGVPGMFSQQVTGVGAQVPTSFYTFAGAGRLWGAHLSFAADTNGAYAGGSARLYAQLKLQSGFVICTIELCLSGPSQVASGDGDPSFPGVPVANGDKLMLDVNNGTGLPGGNGIMSASVVAFASIP